MALRQSSSSRLPGDPGCTNYPQEFRWNRTGPPHAARRALDLCELVELLRYQIVKGDPALGICQQAIV